jgi:hypothetical protein
MRRSVGLTLGYSYLKESPQVPKYLGTCQAGSFKLLRYLTWECRPREYELLLLLMTK